MRFRAIIQARLKSARLPGKVLEKIGSLSLIEHIAQRLAALQMPELELMFAIPENDPPELAAYLRERGYKYHAGPEFDVLARFIGAAQDLGEHDYLLRLTGDNPFPDVQQLARLINYAQQHAIDYGYTAELPLGMGVELIRANALRSIWLRAEPGFSGQVNPIEQYHREHVTVFIRENPHLYEIYPLRLDDSLPEALARERVRAIRLTVDELADLEVCRAVFSHFARLGKPHFGAREVIQLAKNSPELFSGNAHVVQKTAQSVDSRAE